MSRLALPEDVEDFLAAHDIVFPRVNMDALRAVAGLFWNFLEQAGAVHANAVSQVGDVLAGSCGAWHEQLRHHHSHLRDGWAALGAPAYRVAITVEYAIEKLAPFIAGLRDDVVEFVAAYREMVDGRDPTVTVGPSATTALARDIVDTVRARCDTASTAVAECLAEPVKELDEGTRRIQQMIASVDDVGRSVGAVQEMRIDPPEVTKLARALAKYPDDFRKHAHTLVDGLTSLRFLATL